MNVLMPVQMRDALFQYLQSKPYGEVYPIIEALQKLPMANESSNMGVGKVPLHALKEAAS